MPDRFSVADMATMKTRILSRQCSTCILRPVGERIGLSNERVGEFIRSTVERGSYVVCHATFPSVVADVDPAVCRGFADRFDTESLRLIRALWGFVEVEPPDRMCPDPAGHAALDSSHEVTRLRQAAGIPDTTPADRCRYCGGAL